MMRVETPHGSWLAALTLAAALPAAAETRSVEGLEFNTVVLVGSSEVEISQGDGYELQLKGPADELDRQPFYVSSGGLVLGKNKGSRRSFSDTKYRVVMPEIQKVRVAGSGTAYVREFVMDSDSSRNDAVFLVDGSGEIRLYGIKAPGVFLRVKGSGDIRAVSITAKSVEALVSGSGDLFIGSVEADDGEFVVTGSGDLEVTEGGFVREIEVNVIGSGDARLDDVMSEIAEVNIVGSGTATLGECTGTLEASVLGSGDVRYRGDPEVESTAFGSGEIRRQGR